MKSHYVLTGFTNSSTKKVHYIGYLFKAFFNCLLLPAQRLKSMSVIGKLCANSITLVGLNAITRRREYCN
jgi:hypothetical protein